VPLFLICKKRQLEDQAFSRKYSELYEVLRNESNWSLFYFSFFCLRRLLFALFATSSNNSPSAQIFYYVEFSILNIAYLIRTIPFEKSFDNKIEIFNESCILVIGLFLCLFTDFLADSNIQYNIGWIVILIVLLNITVNTFFILKQSIVTLKVTCIKLYNRFKRSKKHVAEIYQIQ
jgi:hypothetical protein